MARIFSKKQKRTVSYFEAQKKVKKFKFRNSNDFKEYRKKFFVSSVPIFPEKTFYKRGWKGWPDFLGYSKKPRSKKS